RDPAPCPRRSSMTAGDSPLGVLIADDDPVVRRLLEVTLTRLGFRVYLASDGSEAVEVYRRQRAAVGVALLDAQMPGLDGAATLAALRAIDPGVRVLLMSGNRREYTPEQLGGVGVAEFLVKPFLPEEVAQALRRAAAT